MTSSWQSTRDLDPEEDAPVARMLDAYWSAAPEPDVEALWQRIAPGLGPQPPPRRLWLVRLSSAFALGSGRAFALAATAAAVAVLMLLGAITLRPQHDASAAVLEAVSDLSSATDSAFDDGELSPDETDDLRRRASELLAAIGANERALNDLTAEELADVVDRLESVLGRISAYRGTGGGDDTELEEAEHSVREVATAVSGERDRRGPSGDDDGHGTGDDRDDDSLDDDRTPTVAPAGIGSATAQAATPTASSTPRATEDDAERESEHDDDHSGPSPSATPASSSATPSSTPAVGASPLADTVEQIPAAAAEYTYAVGQAGTVRFAFDGQETLEVLTATPAAGWTATIEERDGSEIRVSFVANGLRARFEVERHDGQLQISIRWGD